MKNAFLMIAILVSIAAKAQVTKAHLQASGLTCSMCSNSINKALKTLDFIDKINPDIKSYTFEISFKPGAHIDFNKIKNKVEGAGFFVSVFVATIEFNNVEVKDNEPVVIDNSRLLFMNLKAQSLNGTKQVKLLDKGFISAREYKNSSLSKLLLDQDVYHVTL